jgi:hypothetical protein
MKTITANTFCFVISSLTFAAIFHDNISYIAHHYNGTTGKEIHLSHPVDEYLPRIQGSVETGGSASIHQQSGCSLLPSGCPFKP